MLGYTEQEVEQMKEAIQVSIPDFVDVNNLIIVKDLQKAYDLLDGLLMEGYFNK